MPTQIVILIHGLMRSHRSMQKLATMLTKENYQVYNYQYHSTLHTIKEHGSELSRFLIQLIHKNPNVTIHLITHSLGGIIAREALSHFATEKLASFGDLIMLAPPNKGSTLARLFTTFFPTMTQFIKPLKELSDHHSAYVHQVFSPKIKMGIIAGRFDAKVPPAFATLNQVEEFLTVNAAHTFIMNHKKARHAILYFLKNGTFKEKSI